MVYLCNSILTSRNDAVIYADLMMSRFENKMSKASAHKEFESNCASFNWYAENAYFSTFFHKY